MKIHVQEKPIKSNPEVDLIPKYFQRESDDQPEDESVTHTQIIIIIIIILNAKLCKASINRI